MGCSAYVAERYEVKWVCTDIRLDEIGDFVRELENSEHYEVVWYKSDSEMQYEFGRSGLEEVIENENEYIDIDYINSEYQKLKGNYDCTIIIPQTPINRPAGKANSIDYLYSVKQLSELIADEVVITGFYDDKETVCKQEDEFKICKTNDSLYNKSIILVGDSFSEYLVQYLSKVYEISIFVDRRNFDKELLEIYNLDIIIYEAVERYFDKLNLEV